MIKNKILVIGNDKQTQDMLTELLSAHHECIFLANSSEGVSYLEGNKNNIDLILIDLGEVVPNDFQILKSIRQHNLYSNIPILVEVAPNQTDDLPEAFHLGVDDILIKPTTREVAKKRIHNMLEVGKNRKVHNVMEELIESVINENIDTLGICPCPKCHRDLLTLTLNNVKPKYISTERGETVIKATQLASMNDRIQLLTEITRYARLVSDNPRHG